MGKDPQTTMQHENSPPSGAAPQASSNETDGGVDDYWPLPAKCKDDARLIVDAKEVAISVRIAVSPLRGAAREFTVKLAVDRNAAVDALGEARELVSKLKKDRRITLYLPGKGTTVALSREPDKLFVGYLSVDELTSYSAKISEKTS